jgi:hypothetical protein
MNYNELSKEIYEQNKAVGWWDDPDRCKLTLLQLVSTEIAEATEAERKDLMDDHLPHRKGGEVELADAMIRLLDMAGAYGWVYDNNLEDYGILKRIQKVEAVAGKHALLGILISSLVVNTCRDDHDDTSEIYTKLINCISNVSHSQGYDLEGALREKLAYNAKRQDHKRETRAAEGGKKF